MMHVNRLPLWGSYSIYCDSTNRLCRWHNRVLSLFHHTHFAANFSVVDCNPLDEAFKTMLPTLLFTGFLFPLENMPKPLQVIANIVPARWYYLIVKAVMLKGLGFRYVWKETLILLGMTALLLTIALKKFKIRLS